MNAIFFTKIDVAIYSTKEKVKSPSLFKIRRFRIRKIV